VSQKTGPQRHSGTNSPKHNGHPWFFWPWWSLFILSAACGWKVSYGSRTTCVVSMETVAPLQDERAGWAHTFNSGILLRRETPGFISPELWKPESHTYLLT